MILRKPYAFLIKYFKIIHITLFLMFGYLLFKLRSIYIFFQDYVKTNVYTYVEGLASNYIGILMFIIVFLILISAIAIFYLMREKEKPVLFYRILIGYCVVLLMSLIVYYNFYTSLEFETYDKLTLSIYRDIIGVIYYLVYFFIAFTFVRGFGFDIKKFSFDKDLKLLNINESDSEEFELEVNVDKEKIVNAIRKEKRLASYFLKENAVILSIIAVIILGITGFYVYKHLIVENIVYKQGEIVLANNLNYTINDVYIINTDKGNNILDANYVIVNFMVTNPNNSDQKINLSKTRLLVNNSYYYPVINQYELFDDLGIGYNKQSIKNNITSSYIFVFKLKKDVNVNKKLILELYNGEEYRNNELLVDYEKVELKIKYINDNNQGIFKINESVDLSSSLLKNGSFKVLGYDINERFIVDYEECNNGQCNTYKKVITNNNRDILKLNLEVIDLDINFLEDYASLIYYLDGKEQTVSAKDLSLNYANKKNVFFNIPYNLNKAEKLTLKINIRGDIYEIVLKEKVGNAND